MGDFKKWDEDEIARKLGNIFRFIDDLNAIKEGTNLQIITMKSTYLN